MNPYKQAIELIQTRGLAKDEYVDSYGHVCMIGAVATALDLNPSKYHMMSKGKPNLLTPLYPIITKQFPSRLPDEGTNRDAIPYFNDHMNTTQEDVISVLNEAAEHYKED